LASDDASPAWNVLRVVSYKRAIIHAHAIGKTRVELLRWQDEDDEQGNTFFRVDDSENDAILDSLALLF